MEKIIVYLDASALKISSCRRKLYWTIFEGYRSKINAQDIEFGSAFHICPKITEETEGNFGVAMQSALKYYRETPYKPIPKKKYLTDIYLGHVCMEWFSNVYQKDSFDTLRDTNNTENGKYPSGKPLVEIKEAFKVYEDDYCIIYLCGTIDRVCYHRTSKMISVCDYKTTSVWKIDEYLKSYILSCQLYVYTLMLRKRIAECNELSVFHPYKNKDVGGFIEGIFVKGSSDTAGPSIEIKRSEVFVFNKEQQEEFEALLQRSYQIISLLAFNKLTIKDYLPLRDGLINDSCSTKFGPCEFADACQWSDKITMAHVLNSKFKKTTYNPLKFS